jgi:hypothetical protein
MNKGCAKAMVQEVVENKKQVKSLTWLTGENGKTKVLKETPMIGGSLKSLFNYEEQEVLLAKIDGRKNVDSILNHIKKIGVNDSELDCFVVSLIA